MASGVERLLVQEQVDPGAAQLLQGRHQVLDAAAEPIDGPGGQHVVAAPGGVLERLIEAGASIAALAAADGVVGVRRDDLVAGALGPGGQLAHLVLDGLAAGADTSVDRDADHLDCLAAWDVDEPGLAGMVRKTTVYRTTKIEII